LGAMKPAVRARGKRRRSELLQTTLHAWSDCSYFFLSSHSKRNISRYYLDRT
jgi:hypothetical protein